jgi:hypothetical protein
MRKPTLQPWRTNNNARGAGRVWANRLSRGMKSNQGSGWEVTHLVGSEVSAVEVAEQLGIELG